MNRFRDMAIQNYTRRLTAVILDLVQPEVAPFDPTTSKTLPRTKYEADRTTRCRDMAVRNFPKCEVGRSLVDRRSLIYRVAQKVSCIFWWIFQQSRTIFQKSAIQVITDVTMPKKCHYTTLQSINFQTLHRPKAHGRPRACACWRECDHSKWAGTKTIGADLPGAVGANAPKGKGSVGACTQRKNCQNHN